MLNGQVARYRMEDRLREADRMRVSAPLAARRAEKRRAKVRSVSGLVLALFPLSIKH